MTEVKKLYNAFGMNLTPEAELAIHSYLQNDPKISVYGKDVSKKSVSFSKEFIKEEFKEYITLMAKRIDPNDIV